jgi:hypothetical protein
LFFRTALLEYALYRSYFPVWALAAYEARLNARSILSPRTRTLTSPLAPELHASASVAEAE